MADRINFDCDLPDRIARKSYLSPERVARRVNNIHLLSFGADTFRDYLSEKCNVLFANPENRSLSAGNVRQVWQCGKTRIQSSEVNGLTHPAAAREELSLRLKGLVPAIGSSSTLASSGPFSRWVLGRYYARQKFDARNRVHAVLVGNTEDNADWIVSECKKHNVPVFRAGANMQALVPELTSTIKNSLIREILLFPTAEDNVSGECYSTGFEAGYQAARKAAMQRITEAEAKGYRKGVEDVHHGLPLNGLPADKKLPGHLRCPLTNKAMEEPMITRYGQSYEGSAILAYVRKTGKDPLTQQSLAEEDVYPNRVCKDFLRFLKTHGVQLE